ncbi:MAG: PepSY-associated TM helix domain-containing protein [Nitrospira sp.]|nr:PepSY-associated TM helix domain-containing protein [Nitrospira sp.]
METPSDDRQESSSESSAKASRQTGRRIWLNLHMFIGLFVGAIFVIMGLTGSSLVFRRSIDAWLNAHLLNVRVAGAPIPLETVLSNVRSGLPTGAHLHHLELPLNEKEVIRAVYWPAGSGTAIEMLVDPTTGAILGQRERDNHLTVLVYHFHRELFAGKTGETVIGTFGIVLLISLTSGIYLWWPRRGGMKTSLTPRPRASVLQRAYARHKITGALGCIPVFLIACSGIFMEFERVGKALINRVSPLLQDPEVASNTSAGQASISADEAMRIARSHFPSSSATYIEVPGSPIGAYVVGLRQAGEVLKTGGASALWIDQYSGKVLAVRDWENFSAGQTFVTWMLPLHDGEAFGLPGRILVFTAGFVPLTLYVTALRMWQLKRRARRRQQGISL